MRASAPPDDVRVLVLCPSLDTDGPVLEHPVVESPTGGYRAHFLFDDRNAPGPLFRRLGAHADVIPGLRLKTPRAIGRLPLTLYRIGRIVRRLRPQLVLAHGRSVAPFAVLLGRVFGLKTAARLRELHPGRADIYRKFWIDRVDAVVGISRATLAAYEELFPERARAQTNAALLSGARVERLDAMAEAYDFRERFGIPKDATVIGIVGRLVKQKRLEIAIRCAAALRDRKDVLFVHIGTSDDPAYEARMKDLRRELGVEDRVRMLGYVENPMPFYRAMDVLFHPASKEALGRALLEAMAHGRPIVASAVDGIPEIVRDGVEGILCAGDDHEPFLAALRRLLDDPAERAAMGARGRARTERDLSTLAAAEAYGRWFRRVIDARRGPAEEPAGALRDEGGLGEPSASP